MKFRNHFIRLAKSKHWFRPTARSAIVNERKNICGVCVSVSVCVSHHLSSIILYHSPLPSLFLPSLKVLLPKMLTFFKIIANKKTRYNVLMMVCAIDISSLKWAELFNFNEKLEPRVKPSKNTKQTNNKKKTKSLSKIHE